MVIDKIEDVIFDGDRPWLGLGNIDVNVLFEMRAVAWDSMNDEQVPEDVKRTDVMIFTAVSTELHRRVCKSKDGCHCEPLC